VVVLLVELEPEIPLLQIPHKEIQVEQMQVRVHIVPIELVVAVVEQEP
jgi:hypothetical protein